MGENTWADGNSKWMTKASTPVTGDTGGGGTPSNVISNLVACNVASSAPGISMKVEVNGGILIHVALSDIVAVVMEGNAIIIDSSDEIDYKLVFVSEQEAILAEERINEMRNGETVVIC